MKTITKEQWFCLIIIVLSITIVSINNNHKKSIQTVSIHKYNMLEKRYNYCEYKNHIKDVVIANFVATGKIDVIIFSDEIKKHFNPNVYSKQIIPINKNSIKTLDSLGNEWLNSIPYIYIDENHDSTWVKNNLKIK